MRDMRSSRRESDLGFFSGCDILRHFATLILVRVRQCAFAHSRNYRRGTAGAISVAARFRSCARMRKWKGNRELIPIHELARWRRPDTSMAMQMAVDERVFVVGPPARVGRAAGADHREWQQWIDGAKIIHVAMSVQPQSNAGRRCQFAQVACVTQSSPDPLRPAALEAQRIVRDHDARARWQSAKQLRKAMQLMSADAAARIPSEQIGLGGVDCDEPERTDTLNKRIEMPVDPFAVLPRREDALELAAAHG